MFYSGELKLSGKAYPRHTFSHLFSLSPFPKEGQPGVIQSHLGDKLITSFRVSYFFFQKSAFSPPNSYFSPENIFTSASRTCFLFFGNKCIYKVKGKFQKENINFISKTTFLNKQKYFMMLSVLFFK